MSDYQDHYEIPHEIKSRIPDYFYYALWGELVSIFGTYIGDVEFYAEPEDIHSKPEPIYMLTYVTSTGGWNEALYAACKKLDLDFIYEYYQTLEWYDSDRFDGEIEDEMYKHRPDSNNHANPYYRFLCDRGLRKIKENNDG